MLSSSCIQMKDTIVRTELFGIEPSSLSFARILSTYRCSQSLSEGLFTRADRAVRGFGLQGPGFQLAVETVDLHPLLLVAKGNLHLG